MNGKVYLIGAGPGDPDLLTLKGLRCLQSADCVIYDAQVNPELLELVKADAELICLDKEDDSKSPPDNKFASLIHERIEAGKIIARIFGGDPFLFGPGSNEALALAKAGIRFEVAPGVSAWYASPAYAGIPVTQPKLSRSVAFVALSGEPEEEASLDWTKLALAADTLVFSADLIRVGGIADKLVCCGRSSTTPIAVIQGGTYPHQKVLTGTLNTISSQCEREAILPPVLVVVGEVVRFRDCLNWFETLPLFGKRIVVTRPRDQAREFRDQLAGLGAEVIALPTIEIQVPASWEPLDKAIREIEQYQWLVFTSVNGVKHFFDRFRFLRRDIRDLRGVQVCAIGAATERALVSLHIQVACVPEEFKAEGLLEALKEKVTRQSRILIPRAKVARDVLPQQLRDWGAQVDVVEAYQTVLPKASRQQYLQVFKERGVDLIVFTSSSTVSNLAGLIQPETLGDLLAQTTVAAIGPITAQTARQFGLKVSVQPTQYVTSSLLQAICEHYEVSP